MTASFAFLILLGQAQGPIPFTVEPIPDGLRFMAPGDGGAQEIASIHAGPTRDILRHGTAIYVAPVAGGMVVLDAQDPTKPVMTARLAEGKTIVQFAHQGATTLLAMLDDHSALTFDTADPLHPASSQYGAQPAPESGKGPVLAVGGGALIIGGGTAEGFHVGEHVRIATTAHLSPQDQLAVQQGLVASGTTTAVVALERVEAHRSVARLGRGDEARAGDDAAGTNEPLSESLFSPPRIPFTWRIDFGLRPFLDTSGDNTHGIGVLGEVIVAAYFSGAPLRLEVGVSPLGLTTGGSVQHNPAIAIVDLAYATPYFEFGLGTGFSVLAGQPGTYGLISRSGSEVDPLIVQTLRIGSIDGVNVTWRSAIGSSTHQGFQFRSGELVLDIPITSSLNLFFDGAGGPGYDYGDFGVRTYIGGLGGPGTSILSLGLGGAVIADNGESVPGPSLIVGYEVRF